MLPMAMPAIAPPLRLGLGVGVSVGMAVNVEAAIGTEVVLVVEVMSEVKGTADFVITARSEVKEMVVETAPWGEGASTLSGVLRKD